MVVPRVVVGGEGWRGVAGVAGAAGAAGVAWRGRRGGNRGAAVTEALCATVWRFIARGSVVGAGRMRSCLSVDCVPLCGYR